MTQERKMSPEALEHLAGVFKVLGEGGRLTLLQELKQGEMMVGQLVAATGMAQANVSKHLKMMSEVGILSRRKDGVCVYYAVADQMVFDLCELVCGKLSRDRDSQNELEYFI